MIKFYYSGAPNPMKVALMLEETGLAYEAIPVDTRKGEQHKPEFLAINPNAKFRRSSMATPPYSTAMRSYFTSPRRLESSCRPKTPKARGELLSWLMFVASGVGPFSGQSVHFRQLCAREDRVRHQPLYLRGAAPLRHSRRAAGKAEIHDRRHLHDSRHGRCGAGRGSSRTDWARTTGRSSRT